MDRTNYKSLNLLPSLKNNNLRIARDFSDNTRRSKASKESSKEKQMVDSHENNLTFRNKDDTINPLEKADLNSNSSKSSFRIADVPRFKALNSETNPSEKKRKKFNFNLEECERQDRLHQFKRQSEKQSPLQEIAENSLIRPLQF